MIQILGTIDTMDVPAPQPGVPPKPDEATVTVSVEAPYGDGTLLFKMFAAATGGLVVGPCRLQVDQG